MFSTVDLPAPFGPIMEMTERLGMSKLTPSTTALPSYFFRQFLDKQRYTLLRVSRR